MDFGAFDGQLRKKPHAWAHIKGDAKHAEIIGITTFHKTPHGVLVTTKVRGLPLIAGRCREPIFALHIHEGTSCTGDVSDPFANVRTHYNPGACRHPYHAGDLPPLFGADGYAFGACLTDRFTIEQIIGKTIVIHGSFDDFSTQPAGNAGPKIACGEILGKV